MAEREIEVEGDHLVIQTDGRVHRSPVPEWIDPKMFRHIVGAADLLYRQRGAIPTVEQVLNHWGKFDAAVVARAFTAPEFVKALELRGISFNPAQGLTDVQQNAIHILANPVDRRTTEAKLKQIGVSMTVYRGWMRNPLFSSMLSQQSENNLADSIPMVLNRIIGNAEVGDLAAGKLILEMTGRWNPQQQEVQNAKTVVLILMESVQKHVKDKDTLRAIMSEVTERTSALTIAQGLKEL